MKVKDLKNKGGFVPTAPVVKEVTWVHTDDDGVEHSDTFTIHVKKHSFAAMQQLRESVSKDKDLLSLMIHKSITLGENGEEELSYVDAYQLETSLAGVFITAINEVAGVKRADPKN